jgi:hypothetical protein
VTAAPGVSAPETPSAVYRLEASTRCPHCAKDITTIRLLRARAVAIEAEAAGLRAAFDASLAELQREQAMILSEQTRASASLRLDQLLSAFYQLAEAKTTADAAAARVDGLGTSSAQGSRQPSSHVGWASQPTVDEVPQALRDLAFRLANDLEQEYSANAEIGRNRITCQQKLKEQLGQSRRLYAERILQTEDPLEGPMAANFLDQHLIATARARRDTSFGHDLAALVAS